MTQCADGTGFYVGFTVQVDAFCKTEAAQLAAAQSMIRPHDKTRTDATAGIHGVVKFRSAGTWANDLQSLESANADDLCGSLDRKRKGCGRSNPPWEGVIEYNGEFPIEALISCEGDIRRWHPDGSYREGYGWVNGADVEPTHAKGAESLGRLAFQWEGGNPGERGFVKWFDANGNQVFPTTDDPPKSLPDGWKATEAWNPSP